MIPMMKVSQKTQLAQTIVGKEVVVGRDVGEVVEGVGVVVIREAMEGVVEEVRVVEEVVVGRAVIPMMKVSQKTQLARAIVGEEVIVGRDVGEAVEGVGVVVREAMEGDREGKEDEEGDDLALCKLKQGEFEMVSLFVNSISTPQDHTHLRM